MARWAVIGLGNPGSQYENTRHNVGFWAVDYLWNKLQFVPGAEKYGSQFAKGQTLEGDEMFLVKPLQYMNRSGEAASPLIRFFKIEIGNIIVVHDDVDLESGALRVKRGGGTAGQHGLEDLVRHLGSADFYRVRVGIGRPPGGKRGDDLSGWVLGRPAAEERDRLKQTAEDAGECALALISKGLEPVSQKFGRSVFRG